MALKKIQTIFAFVVFVALIFLGVNLYSSYSFKNNPLSTSYQEAIVKKEQEVLAHMKKNFGYMLKVPIVISDKIPGRVYGVTSYDKNGKIKIHLNKKVMKESFEYIISDVIAHEYAHALLFKNGYYARGGERHSKQWQQTCVKLGGANCQKYVDSHDVIMGKLPF